MTTTVFLPTADIAADGEDIIIADSIGSTSDYDDTDYQSSTQSLASSIREYVYENGRRYHSPSAANAEGYLLPNDEVEQDRLDMSHHALSLLLGGKLFLAPVENPQRILDCGTGTGIWALDVSDMFTEAVVTGVDISPIQPSWVTPNVRFEVDDLQKKWTWDENHFDFIFSRILGPAISDWPSYIKQMFKHTKPGGYVEIVEHDKQWQCDDGTLTPDTAVAEFFSLYWESLDKLGLVYPEQQQVVRWMEEAGFVDVVIKTFKQPNGHWPKDKRLKEIGTATLFALEPSLEAYGLALITRACDISPEEFKKICKAAFMEMRTMKVHAYGVIWHVYGRKPEVGK